MKESERDITQFFYFTGLTVAAFSSACLLLGALIYAAGR